MARIETGLRGIREVQPLAEFFNAIARLRTSVESVTFAAASAARRSTMGYRTDRRSRTRAIAVYLTLLLIGATLGFLVRFGVITDHMLW
ncbi:hypothetical protein [Sphingomonas sp. CFBP 8760]|uniref:hypothetical protein n=1 Tax=Sphingomonas sp. CFBP 8760 TaxID=2775282 RepID=UPI00178211C9|nr:hypothetical protein [Sphingomonas sp. CFBP 8760]MBD8548061.1 hypothetical protein [Sphingomonas sp. CFBP 8760]